MIQDGQLLNYSVGTWKRSRASEFLDVHNPATAETMVRVSLSSPDEVDEAACAAQSDFADWRRMPPTERIQYLFKLKALLEKHFDEIATLTTQECGKTLAEAQRKSWLSAGLVSGRANFRRRMPNACPVIEDRLDRRWAYWPFAR